MTRGGTRRLAMVGIALAAFVLIAWVHDVPTRPTVEDRTAIAAILAARGYADLPSAPPRDFAAQLAAIKAVQDAVLATAPLDEGIPLGEAREPADLLRYRRGLCYDRSRAIEKALAAMGLEARHIAVYAVADDGSALGALLTPGVDSHALSEVRTERGWLLVDSNSRWLGLDRAGAPVSIARLAGAGGAEAIAWSPDQAVAPNPIFAGRFTYLYGLFSRHGRFFAPMTPIPDMNWGQFVGNLG